MLPRCGKVEEGKKNKMFRRTNNERLYGTKEERERNNKERNGVRRRVNRGKDNRENPPARALVSRRKSAHVSRRLRLFLKI